MRVTKPIFTLFVAFIQYGPAANSAGHFLQNELDTLYRFEYSE